MMGAMPEWTIVVPVKGTASAKSRLGGTPELALAIALDTVAAALEVAPVIVVTPLAAPFEELGARVIADDQSGLSAAIRQGVNAAGDGAVAVLLGDLPAMQPAELEAALEAAGRHPLAFVPDAEGTGTVLVTALRAADHAPAFGADSCALHLAAGYVELDIAASSGLRRDVDTRAQLASLAGVLGPRTSSVKT
jgi:2-phospho-L-lactate guanylyltransferase